MSTETKILFFYHLGYEYLIFQVTNRGLTTSYKNFTLFGVKQGTICGKIRKSFNTWRGDLCFSKLTSSVSSETGPGVPFKGKDIDYEVIHKFTLE